MKFSQKILRIANQLFESAILIPGAGYAPLIEQS